MVQIQFFFYQKGKKIRRPEHPLTPHPLRPIASYFCQTVKSFLENFSSLKNCLLPISELFFNTPSALKVFQTTAKALTKV